MPRLGLALLFALALVAAACTNDDDGSASGAAGAAGDSSEDGGTGTGDGDGATTGSTGPTTTLQVFTPASEVSAETPFSIPPLDTDEIDVMLDEAFEDDEVTADEIAAVLEVAGVEPELAKCEADLLVSLGVEDVSGGVELQQALDAMTDEDHQQLEACFNG